MNNVVEGEVSDRVAPQESDLGALVALSGPLLGAAAGTALIGSYQLWPYATAQFMNAHFPVVAQLSHSSPPDIFSLPGFAAAGFLVGAAAEVVIVGALYAAGETCAYLTRRRTEDPASKEPID